MNDSKPVEIVLVPAERIMPFEPVVVGLAMVRVAKVIVFPA